MNKNKLHITLNGHTNWVTLEAAVATAALIFQRASFALFFCKCKNKIIFFTYMIVHQINNLCIYHDSCQLLIIHSH